MFEIEISFVKIHWRSWRYGFL